MTFFCCAIAGCACAPEEGHPQPGQVYTVDAEALFSDLQPDSLVSRLFPLRYTPDIATEYLMAEFAPGAKIPETVIDYGDNQRYLGGRIVEPQTDSETVRVYFPVFKFSERFIAADGNDGFSDFAAVRLAP